MYSAWARRKRNRFTTAVLLVVLLALIGVYVVFTSAPATCSDGTQNQNEEGIDCGGVCTRVCSENVQDIRLEWVRGFVDIVYDNTQNAMAVSQTYLQTLGARAQTPISFVWQEQFPRPVSRVEIVPRIPQAL
jgi:hypothetical protein